MPVMCSRNQRGSGCPSGIPLFLLFEPCCPNLFVLRSHLLVRCSVCKTLASSFRSSKVCSSDRGAEPVVKLRRQWLSSVDVILNTEL